MKKRPLSPEKVKVFVDAYIETGNSLDSYLVANRNSIKAAASQFLRRSEILLGLIHSYEQREREGVSKSYESMILGEYRLFVERMGLCPLYVFSLCDGGRKYLKIKMIVQLEAMFRLVRFFGYLERSGSRHCQNKVFKRIDEIVSGPVNSKKFSVQDFNSLKIRLQKDNIRVDDILFQVENEPWSKTGCFEDFDIETDSLYQ